MKWENNMNESGKTMNGSKSNVNGGVSDNGSGRRRRLNRLMMRYTTPRLDLTNRLRCNKQ